MNATKRGIGNQRAHGAAILARLAETGIPSALKVPAKTFAQTHEALEEATARAENAREKRDLAIANIGDQDDVLDAAIITLADKIVGAGMGSRGKPFASFGKLSPSAIAGLAYADEVVEIRNVVAKIGKAKPPADVARAAAACAKAANAVEKALEGLPGPQSSYVKALAARDAHLLTWTKALGRLKNHAAIVWDDDPATFKAVFAPPEAMLAPVKRRTKKASSTNGATPTPPPA